MSGSIRDLAWIESLDSVVDRYDLSTDEFCIVGSGVLAVYGLRANDDLDICFHPAVADEIDTGAFEGIQPAPNKYEHIGLSDTTLLADDRYHDSIDGYPVIRPEIEYSHKRVRGWKKDMKDVELLEQYKTDADDWKPQLERHDYTPGPGHLLRRGVCALKTDGVWETIGHGITYLRWHGPLPRRESDYSGQPTSIPGKALRSYREDGARRTVARGIRLAKLNEPTGLLDRYSRLRHKAKVGTLVDRQLELWYPTGDLLREQYVGDSFVQMDLIVALLAADAMVAGNNVPPVVDRFENASGVEISHPLRGLLDSYEHDRRPPTVPIGYDSSILDVNKLAVAVLDDPTAVPVSIGPGTNDDPSSFERIDPILTDDQRALLESRFSSLLYDSGALFPVVFWPPAQPRVEEMLAFVRDEKPVHFTMEIALDDDEFDAFVWDMYESQTELDPKHIETKIAAMDDYQKAITVAGIEVATPRIREGIANEVIQLKERVREEFTPRILTDNPSANLLIHGGDNFVHNRETWAVIERYSDDDIRSALQPDKRVL